MAVIAGVPRPVQPLQKPLNGVYYDWPVGFHVGLNLQDYWQLEEHKLGELSFTHFPDGTAHKNRMQGNDFAQSEMFKHGVTCWSCHDVHGTRNEADTLKPAASKTGPGPKDNGNKATVKRRM